MKFENILTGVALTLAASFLLYGQNRVRDTVPARTAYVGISTPPTLHRNPKASITEERTVTNNGYVLEIKKMGV